MGKWLADRRGAYFFIWLGVGLILVFGALEYRFPQAAQLETARGRVLWQQETRGALYFILADRQQLVLYAKGDADGSQRAAIRDAAAYPVAVTFFRRQQTGIGFAPGVFYTAYGVAVGGKQVASYDQVRAAYRSDNLVALALGVAAVVAGMCRLRALGSGAGAGAGPGPGAGAGAGPSRRRAGGGRSASRRSR